MRKQRAVFFNSLFAVITIKIALILLGISDAEAASLLTGMIAVICLLLLLPAALKHLRPLKPWKEGFALVFMLFPIILMLSDPIIHTFRLSSLLLQRAVPLLPPEPSLWSLWSLPTVHSVLLWAGNFTHYAIPFYFIGYLFSKSCEGKNPTLKGALLYTFILLFLCSLYFYAKFGLSTLL